MLRWLRCKQRLHCNAQSTANKLLHNNNIMTLDSKISINIDSLWAYSGVQLDLCKTLSPKVGEVCLKLK